MAIVKLATRFLASNLLCIAMLACLKITNVLNGNIKLEITQSNAIPNDPLFSRQYYFNSMQVLKAWEFTKGDPNCLIGILERDADVSHPDYKNNIRKVYRLDGMVYKNYRAIIHGTQVIGLIAAEKNNGIGIAGLAPECNVIVGLYGMPPVSGLEKRDYLDQFQSITHEKISLLIKYMVDEGCKVINCSFKFGSLPVDIFDYAIKKDVLIVLASGNDNTEKLYFNNLPDDILVVGGINRNNRRWEEAFFNISGKKKGSNYGEFLNIVAPVEGLVVCYPRSNSLKSNKGLFKISNTPGTSYAAPMATSLVALIRSMRPDIDAKTVIEIIQQGADDLGAEGWDKQTGYGKLNFYKSLKLAQSWPRQ